VHSDQHCPLSLQYTHTKYLESLEAIAVPLGLQYGKVSWYHVITESIALNAVTNLCRRQQDRGPAVKLYENLLIALGHHIQHALFGLIIVSSASASRSSRYIRYVFVRNHCMFVQRWNAGGNVRDRLGWACSWNTKSVAAAGACVLRKTS
jgi:hypothetical protein